MFDNIKHILIYSSEKMILAQTATLEIISK